LLNRLSLHTTSLISQPILLNPEEQMCMGSNWTEKLL